MPQRKQQQRLEALTRRDKMSAKDRVRLSHALVAHVDALIDGLQKKVIENQVIAGFWPIRSEIDPRYLMAALQERGALLALPALLGKGADKRMIFRHFESEQALIPMEFGTFGPSECATAVEPDIILLPLAAFDGKGNRIGYGAGFYDRTIAGMHASGCKPALIGLSFDCQRLDNISTEPHDIRLDAVMTESGWWLFH